MKVAIATLGCKVNQSESSSIEGSLRENNFEIVQHTDNPDIFIVNTCTVTAKSDYQSRQLIRRAVRSGAKVIATGCYAQLRPDELLKIEGLDLVIGNSAKHRIVDYLLNFPEQPGKLSMIVDSPETPMILQPYHSTRARAFLKIQDGCNFSCSYCAVPMARGRSRSLSPEDVLTAVKRLEADGYMEIVLTGIHIGSYGLELQPESSLLDLVDILTTKHNRIRFRLSSIEPREFKSEFLSYIKRGSVCAHLHIPLQSGSDRILKEMRRGYTTSFFMKVIEDIVSKCPDISIGTDVIVGFPGESEIDFKKTADLLELLPLSYFHVFPYSSRPGTAASLSAHQVDKSIRQERVKMLFELSGDKRKQYMAGYVGKTLNVIVENNTETEGQFTGITDNYLRVSITSNDLVPGQHLRVRVISLTQSGLSVKLLAQPLCK